MGPSPLYCNVSKILRLGLQGLGLAQDLHQCCQTVLLKLMPTSTPRHSAFLPLMLPGGKPWRGSKLSPAAEVPQLLYPKGNENKVLFFLYSTAQSTLTERPWRPVHAAGHVAWSPQSPATSLSTCMPGCVLKACSSHLMAGQRA